jgi:SulP family sulfate permease
VPYIDQSGLYAFEDAITNLQQAGIDVVFCALQDQPRGMLEKIGLIPNLVPSDKIIARLEDFASTQ